MARPIRAGKVKRLKIERIALSYLLSEKINENS